MTFATLFRKAGFAALLGAAVLASPAAFAAQGEPKPQGTFKDWNVYSIEETNRVVCFAVSEPKTKTLSNPSARRGDPFFLVTRWGAGQTMQPSVIIGFPQKSGSKTKVAVGKTEFELFVDGDGAWMDSEDGDKKLLEAMKKGDNMVVKGVSGRGTTSEDRYSLNGLSAALDKIAEICK